MAFKEFGGYDAVGLAELVRKKQVSAGELLDEAIARTAKVDPQINAVVVKHYDYAKKQIDRGLPDGPFTGVPFLLKDIDILAGTVTTSGASIFGTTSPITPAPLRNAFSRPVSRSSEKAPVPNSA